MLTPFVIAALLYLIRQQYLEDKELEKELKLRQPLEDYENFW